MARAMTISSSSSTIATATTTTANRTHQRRKAAEGRMAKVVGAAVAMAMMAVMVVVMVALVTSQQATTTTSSSSFGVAHAAAFVPPSTTLSTSSTRAATRAAARALAAARARSFCITGAGSGCSRYQRRYRSVPESASSSALFMAAAASSSSNENDRERKREGGAASMGLSDNGSASGGSSGGTMSSILDDGKGHINAELARSIWEWENEHLKNMTDASSTATATATSTADQQFPAANIKFSTRRGLKMVEEIAQDLLSLQSEETSVTFSDLVQEGVLSLITALAKYDPSKSSSDSSDSSTTTKSDSAFESYARQRILRSMEKSLADAAYRPLRLPEYVYDTIRRAKTVASQLRIELDREPTLAEIAAKIPKATPEKLQFYTLAARTSLPVESTVEIYDPESGGTDYIRYADEDTYTQSLTESPSTDGPYLHSGEIEEVLGEEETEWMESQRKLVAPLRDFIADETAEGNPEVLASEEMMRMDIDELMAKTLDEREVEIIRLKFGLDGGAYDLDEDETDIGSGRTTKNGLTFAEIGKRLGLSPQRVAQLEQSALDKLRENYSSEVVEVWLNDEHGDEVST